MASESTSSTATRSRATNDDDAKSDAVQSAVQDVRGVLEDVGRSMPDVARASRSAVDDLFKAIETGSDERITAGVSLSLGLALGMLLGGAPRLLIIIALAPVVAAGLVLSDRRTKTGRSTT